MAAAWPSGKAEDCKSFIPSSNLGAAFIDLGRGRAGAKGFVPTQGLQTLNPINGGLAMAISRPPGGVLAGRFVLGGTPLPDPSGGSIESPGLVPVPLVRISVGGGQWAISVHCPLVRGPMGLGAPQVKAGFTGSMDKVKRFHHCNGERKLDGCRGDRSCLKALPQPSGGAAVPWSG